MDGHQFTPRAPAHHASLLHRAQHCGPHCRWVGSGHWAQDCKKEEGWGREEGARSAWEGPGPVPLRESLRETPSLPQPVNTFYKAPPFKTIYSRCCTEVLPW